MQRNLLYSLTLMLGLLTSGCANPPSLPLQAPHARARFRGTTPDPASHQPAPVGTYRAAAVSGDYVGYPLLEKFIGRMVAEQGYTREYLDGLFSQAHRKQWTIDYMSRQAPVAGGKPHPGAWSRYRAKFLDEQHIAKGAAFWRLYAESLRQASERYGVPPEYIMGIMGVETFYGGNVGHHRVIDALVTLAFDYPRRAAYFTEELANFLIMARDEGVDPSQPVGSFAGAMGLGQFMPGSFSRWAVDFDGNGRRDLWNPEDAIGSIANYFAQHGWRSTEPVATPAVASDPVAETLESGFDKRYPLASLAKVGIRPVKTCPTDEARLLRLSTHKGQEYWLGHENFHVLTRYNNSTHYAMAVHQLAQAIKERYTGAALPNKGAAKAYTR